MSDEQEVIYVHAPDPYGFLNAYAPVTIEAYTGLDLAAEIARAYTRLVSFNNKVLSGTGAGEADETWVQEGLASLAADLTGFGAVNYGAVWDYMDAPHLVSLVADDDVSVISSAGIWGSQYLFLRWLMDNVEPKDITQGTLWQIVQGANNGSEGIASNGRELRGPRGEVAGCTAHDRGHQRGRRAPAERDGDGHRLGRRSAQVPALRGPDDPVCAHRESGFRRLLRRQWLPAGHLRSRHQRPDGGRDLGCAHRGVRRTGDHVQDRPPDDGDRFSLLRVHAAATERRSFG